MDNSTLVGGEMQYALGTTTEVTQPYTTSITTATSDEKVAIVTKKGRIKAVGAGTCDIWVYAQNSRSCKVTVVVK